MIKIYSKAYKNTVNLTPISEICVSYDYTYSGSHLAERKLTVEVDSPTEIDFSVGDFAYLDLYGQQEKFFLHSIPIGNRVHNSLMIKYSLTFWWRGYELKTIAFLDYIEGVEVANSYNRNTGEVYVNGTIVQLMDRIKANMNRAYNDGWYGSWQYGIHGSVDVVTNKDISLQNQYCWDALLLVDSLFGVSFRIEFDSRIILVGYPPDQVSLGGHFNFEFGKDKGLCEITRLENTDALITRVYAYGSTRNISPKYRTGEFGHGYSPRLMLPADLAPGGYLANTTLEAKYGIREAFYINDEIYPTINGLDNAIKDIEDVIDRPDGDDGYSPQYEYVVVKEPSIMWKIDPLTGLMVEKTIPQTVKRILIPRENYDIFVVYISDMLPDVTDENIAAGVTAKMEFTTGLLTGNTFEITAYEKEMTLDDDGVPVWDNGFGKQYYKVTLKRINNDDNYYLPNSVIKPQPGDKFVFLDIFMPANAEEAAEDLLYADTVEYLQNHSGVPLAYFIRIPEEFVEKNINIQYYLRESVLAKITDTILNADATYLIQSITISWKKENLLPTYDLTLSDKPIKSKFQLIESSLKNATNTTSTNKYNTDKQLSNIEKSASISFNRVFNNNWDINGWNVAPQSIQLKSQSIELRSTRYILQAYLRVNYLGNANSAHGTSGVLIHKDSDIVWGGIYDLEHQTWTIEDPQTFVLESDKYYWAYIKCDLIDGTAVWVLSETKIFALEIEDYYMFEWGQINPNVGDYRFSQNAHGINGIDSFVYIAYGSSLAGADFTTTNDPALEYMAILSTTTVIVTPAVGDFVGLWFKRKGDAGGGGGGSDVEAGDGMDFITNDPVTLGLPSTIDSTTENAVTETSHTHELGNISVDSITNGKGFINLYSQYVVFQASSITSSTDWIVPSKDDWADLFSFLLGSTYTIGSGVYIENKLRLNNSDVWDSLNSYPTTNELGLNFIGSGTMYPLPTGFVNLKQNAFLWTSDLNFSVQIGRKNYCRIYDNAQIPKIGCTIRLINKDTLLSNGETGIYVGNNGIKHKTVCINGVEWLAEDLIEYYYRDETEITFIDIAFGDIWGDIINNPEYTTVSYVKYFMQELTNHPPVTIHPDSASRASIDGNQVLTIEAQTGGQPYQVLTAKDIEAGTAQSYDLIIKCRQEITIESIVVECDSGTLTGCTVTIGATAITFASGTFSVSTTLTEIAATADNVASAGDRVKINTSTGYTGTPTVLNVQLNYTVN